MVHTRFLRDANIYVCICRKMKLNSTVFFRLLNGVLYSERCVSMRAQRLTELLCGYAFIDFFAVFMLSLIVSIKKAAITPTSWIERMSVDTSNRA